MENLWYKNAVLYAIDLGSFADGNGDGVGDFQGLIQRLGYIGDLGVTCLWLTPFYPSPFRDNGYDVANYYAVDPRFGTLDDFIELVEQAGERGIRVIIDLVVNHTSDQHPWFQAARRDPDSGYRDYYIWSEHPPPIPPDKGTMFEGQEQTVWKYDPVARAYYYHRFYDFQPELNVANPAVREELERIMDFWLTTGISGMRIDAASHLVEEKGGHSTASESPHSVLKGFRSFVDRRTTGVVLIGETDVAPEQIVSYFGDNDELHLIFNFLLNNHIFLGLATEDAAPIAHAVHLLTSAPEGGQWANFLRNFDELDLERLSESQRQTVFEAFAPSDDMRIFGRGIRRRLAPMLGGDRRRLELAYSLLFSLPGAPVMIYGDEIGMGEDLSLPGRNAVRTAMQWSDGDHAGFSAGSLKELPTPLIRKGKFSYKKINVAAQQQDPDSLLQWFKRLVQLRRSCPEIGNGSARTLTTHLPHIVSNCYEWKDGLVVAIHNLSGRSCEVDFDLGDVQQRPLLDLWNHTPPRCEEGSTYRIEIAGYGYRWYRAGTQ